MRLTGENKLEDEDLHRDMIDAHIHSDVMEGKLTGSIYFPEWLSEDGWDVAAYTFDVKDIIEDFIDLHQTQDGKISEDDKEEAEAIILDLLGMVESLRAHL